MAEGLDLISYQDAITAFLRAQWPDYKVFEDSLDDDSVIIQDNFGKMEAFIVLRYGPMLPKHNGKSMGGARLDEYYGTVDVMAIGSKGRIARSLCASITDDLIGFSPDGASSLTVQDDGGMFAAFVVSQNQARPTRFIASQRFRFNVNNVNAGKRVRP